MPALPVRLAALGILLAVAVSSPARSEPDAEGVARGLTEAIAAIGDVSATYDAAAVDGETVTITGLRVTLADATVLTVPTVVVTNVTPRESGGFTAGRIDFDDGAIASPDRLVGWATASVEDVVVPPAAEVRSHPKIRPFRSLSTTGVNLSAPAWPAPIEAASVSLEVEDIVEDAPANIRASAIGVRLPAALIGNSVVGAIVGMLNYEEFVADISLDGVYDTAGDTASVASLAVDIATVGKIDLSARASSFSVRAITDPDEEVAKQARADARLDSLRVRIDNAGFVERVLDMQATMLGGTRDDVRAQIVNGALPFALSFVKNEAFRVEFRDAIAVFLEDPRSLTIVVEPDEPLPLGQVARTAVRSPMALPDLLIPKVVANN